MSSTWKRCLRVFHHEGGSNDPGSWQPVGVRRRLTVFAVAAITTVAIGVQPGVANAASPAPGCPISTSLEPSCGVLMGVATHKLPGQTWEQSVAAHGQLIGRQVDVLHNYHQWNSAFPDAAETARALGGQELLLTWIGTRQDGTVVRWASIASGTEDAVIDASANRFKALGVPVWLNFQNEPEALIGVSGTAAEYVTAWRHIHDRFAADGVTNVVWDAVFMGVTSDNLIAKFRALYPGDSYVDWIAWDPNNRNAPWASFADAVRPFYDWLMDNGYGSKPFMLAEYGVVEDPANAQAKANWFTAEAVSLTDGEFPNLKVVSYFDHPYTDGTSGNFVIDTSQASSASYAALGQVLLSASTTPVTTPGLPTAVSAAAGSSSAVVSWTPPTNTGAGVITAYTVKASPGGSSVTVGGPLPVTKAAVSGLTPGTSYTFAVAAANSSGSGSFSTPSNAIVPKAILASVPSPTAAGWQRNGAAVLSNGLLRLTDAVTKQSVGTAFWPTAITAASFCVSFDAVIDGGTGADGLTVAFADYNAGARPTSKGQAGGGLGWSGIPGFAVALDTYLNGTDPSNNFIGLATGFNPASNKDLIWKATSITVPPLRATHHITIVAAGGLLFVSVDGTQVLSSSAALPAKTLIGFTASDGNRVD